MALVLQDRVREISTTTGDGTVTLSGAYPGGYRTFASCVPNGSTVYYCIHNTANGVTDEWEVGFGTYSSNTLTRTTVYSSSNAGSKTVFSAGDKEVFITYPAERAVYEEDGGTTVLRDGPLTVVGANVTSYTSFGASLGEFYANIDGYAQLYVQNLNSGQNASTDIVAYNDETGGNVFIDVGVAGTNYSEAAYPIFTANAGYLYNDGGDLLVGSASDNVVIFAGGVDPNNTVVTFGTDLSTTLEGALTVDGTATVNGVTTLNNFAYTTANIAAAANSTVLVTKAYVDNATSNGFHVHEPVLVATTGNLTATYNNGTDGVGATLTNSGTQVALEIDGVSMNVADRVLVWQQTTGAQNGVYVVTTVGDGSTNWVLTRSSDANTSSEGDPNSLGGGDYFFVNSGATLGFFAFVCVNDGAIVFGTTDIEFNEFSQVPSYIVNSPLDLTGNVLSLSGTVAATNGGTGVNTVTTGDLLYGSASNTWSKLALGAANKSLVVNGSGTQVEWNAVPLSASGAVSGTLDETNGGTGNATYTTGDTLYSSATNTLAKLAGNTTTTKKFLGQTGNGSASAAPVWEQPAASDITGLAASATTDTTNASNISSGTLANARTTASSSNGASTIVARDASGNFAAGTITANLTGTASNATVLQTARTIAISGGATGTATSFNGSAAITIPVTAMNASVINTGVISNSYTTASSSNGASTIVARDASGNFTAANVSATNFIGTLNGSGANVSTLNASSISTGTLASARVSGSYTGITGVGTLTAGTWNASAISDTYLSTISTAGKVSNSATTASSSNGASTIVARDASGNFSAGTITATLSGAATSATTATNLAGGGAGQLPYNSGSGTTAFLAAGTAGYILQSNGTSAPSWVVKPTGTVTSVATSGSINGLTLTGGTITSTGTITLGGSITSVNTSANLQMNSLGVGTAGSGTAGEIRATNNITAYYSDDRLKNNLGNIPNALSLVKSLNGFYYEANQTAVDLGYEVKREVGVSAQQVQAIMPEVVAPAPIDDKYLTVRYERLVPLLIEAIKELEAQVAELKAK